MPEQALHEPERVRSVPVLAHQQPADILARQRRFELTQLVGVEFVDLDPVVARGFEKFEPAIFNERDIAPPKLDLKQVAVMSGAEQHGLPFERDARLPVL